MTLVSRSFDIFERKWAATESSKLARQAEAAKAHVIDLLDTRVMQR
jgi:hypothetical protein